jgi:outer membrane protein insertion porin family
MSLFPGQTVSPADVARCVRILLDMYAEKHRHSAVVTPVWGEPDSGNRSVLVFECEEGPDIRVGEIDFIGNEAFDDHRLRGRMSTRQDSFWRSGRFRESDFTADLGKVEAYYHDHGYPEARVTGVERSMLADARHLRFEISVEEGEHYSFGDISFSGNEAYPDSVLAGVLKIEPGAEYNQSDLDGSLMTLYELVQELGYFYASIEPTVSAGAAPATLDVSFSIAEGERAHIRRVDITGNNRTYDNVIRREISIFPGDLFQRSALMRSYRNIYYTNYFQDVMVDFRYLDDSPDVDLVFDVTEKSTGKAGIGASYGGEDGFSGFLELGETNLFGRGQTVSLNYQFSSSKQDVDLSFTEPWFMDTPLSLGGQVFHTTTDYTEYDRRRTGGAVTVGRTLPWIDYSSASIRYMLEKVYVYNITDDSTSYYYSLRDQDWPRWTSSVSLNLSRDSRDRQNFASSGSFNSLTAEFAGAALGGSICYQKYLLDSSWYLPSFWRFIFFLRGRAGIVTSLAGEEPPAYELFELGGTGFYGVRGYDTGSIGAVEGYETVGGRSMLILSAEYRCRLIDQLQLAVFADAGNTWNSWSSSSFSDLRRGAGAGIRLEVPMLGILGFDYAYGFDGPDPGWQPHFQFGTTF